MRALVVYESMYGNTKQIAQAVAEGLSGLGYVDVTDVADAPSSIADDIDALVVGGPTHSFSMSRRSTREEAVRGGAPATAAPVGIREWLHSLQPRERRLYFVAFDTRVDLPLVPGAASRSATRVARKLGFHVLKPESFYVRGYVGPLEDGELERAHRWGSGLGRVITGQ